MNSKIFYLIFLISLNSALAQDQNRGKSTFKFVEMSTSVYDEAINDYKEVETKKGEGTILMNIVDKTVTIEHSSGKRIFKLLGTTIESDTYRTLYQLKENNENYVLAESVYHFSLIGTTTRIIYSLRK